MLAFNLNFTKEDFYPFARALLEKKYRIEDDALIEKIVDGLFDHFLDIGGGQASWLLAEIQNLKIVKKDHVRNYLEDDDDYLVFTMFGELKNVDD